MAPSNTMASASGGIDASRDSVHPPGYAIPEKYKARLEEVQVKDKDTRSDEEIIAMLKTHVPVTSEKNIWGYWHSGIDGMPDWCRRNVLDWIRMLGPSWTVRIVDNQPGSPNHFLQFISPEMVPECFINGTHHGKFQGPHSADFVRVPLVYLYGGASLDVGTYLTRHPERWMWEPLEDETSGVEVIISLFYGSVLSNSFVAAKKGNKWMKRWNDSLLHVWKDRDSHEGLVMHPMLAFTHNITFEETRASGNLWEYVLEPQECIEYLTQMFLWVRMTMLEGNGDPDDFDYASYWQTKVRALNLHKETQAMDTLYKWHNAGPRHFELLTISVHPPQPDNPDWQEAHDLVWHLLSETTMQKISTGRGVLDEKTLGILWPENPGKDAAENTFAHLLRYGALHFRQTRATVELAKCEKPKVTVKRGLLEYPPEGQPI